MRLRGFLAVVLAAVCGAPFAVRGQFSIAEQFSASVITNRMGETLPVRVWRRYQPKDCPVPVVVLLHGSGECGTDNAAQLTPFRSFYQTVLVDASLPPALYLIPQCTQRNGWVREVSFEAQRRLPRYPAPALRTVKEYLDALVQQKVADPDRLYIGGYSLGGFGTWDAISRWPGYFAAAVPVCGGGAEQAEAVAHAAKTAVWAFHGAADAVVPVVCSRRMIAALGQAGVVPKYTEYPGAGHNIWVRAFGDSAMVRWMFRQRRGQVEQAPGTSAINAFFRQLKAYVTPD